MATGNFYCKNTSSIFAIGMNYYITQEDIDANNWDQELLDTFDEDMTNWKYQDQKNYAQELLKQAGWDICDAYDNSSNRSYPASIIADYSECRVYAGISLDLSMEAKVVSGYYEGACFDLDAELKIYDKDGYLVAEYSDLEEIEGLDSGDVISDNWQGNLGLSKIHAAGVIKSLESFIEELKNQAEQCFKQAAEYRLGCIGHGSNGEAFYVDLDKN